MGNIRIENSKCFIKSNYPEVMIHETSLEIIFDGRFIIDARKGEFEIQEAPHLKIVMNKQYPQILPVCYDVDHKIKYDHVSYDHSLCVSTPLDMAYILKDSCSIQDYIEKLIIPYFLSYRFWQKTGKDLNGDRSHGNKGIYESLREYLCCNICDEELKYLLCWAAKLNKFKKCVPLQYQSTFKKQYIKYVKQLRFLGIFSLRQQYKMLYLK